MVSGQPAILILAAGESSRMGQPKQAMEINRKPMLFRTAEAAISTTFSPVVIVTGAHQKVVEAAIQSLPITLVHNHDWKLGMGTSLKKGVTKILELQPQISSVIVLLSDQPFVDQQLLLTLSEKHLESNSPIVASFYSNSPGVPVLFNKAVFPEILELPAEAGAKKLLMKYKDQLVTVPFALGNLDVDTPEDFQKVKRMIELPGKSNSE